MFGETLRETLRPFDLPDGVAAMLKRGAGRVVQDVHYYNENNSIPPPHPPDPTKKSNDSVLLKNWTNEARGASERVRACDPPSAVQHLPCILAVGRRGIADISLAGLQRV